MHSALWAAEYYRYPQNWSTQLVARQTPIDKLRESPAGMDNGSSSSGDEYGDTYDEHSAVHRAEPKLEAPPPGLTEMEGQLQRWRSTRYRRPLSGADLEQITRSRGFLISTSPKVLTSPSLIRLMCNCMLSTLKGAAGRRRDGPAGRAAAAGAGLAAAAAAGRGRAAGNGGSARRRGRPGRCRGGRCHRGTDKTAPLRHPATPSCQYQDC